MLHCWGQHLLLLLPLLLPDLDHRPGPAGHQGARAQLHSELEDQGGLAGLQEAHWLLLGLQLVPKVRGKHAVRDSLTQIQGKMYISKKV